jgi:hypothetical protein
VKPGMLRLDQGRRRELAPRAGAASWAGCLVANEVIESGPACVPFDSSDVQTAASALGINRPGRRGAGLIPSVTAATDAALKPAAGAGGRGAPLGPQADPPVKLVRSSENCPRRRGVLCYGA